MLRFFILYFLKWDISFLIPNKLTKLFVANVAGAHSRYSLVVEKWSFVSMGEDMEYRRQITCILKGKSITIIVQIVIFFKHKNVELLFAFTIVHDK